MMSTVRHVGYAPHYGWIHSTRLHLILTTLLAIGMPFLMLRAYMQERIGMLSTSMFEMWGKQIPCMPLIALPVAIIALALLRRYINWGRIAAAGGGVLMIAYAQYINDYYFGHRFYELQMNWHYFAYMLLAIMAYRDLSPRGYTPSQVIGITYVGALLFSTFDEGFQFFINSRVFDSGDISKDAWGALIGLLLVYSGSGEVTGWLPIRHRRLRDYFGFPGSLLVMLGTIGFSLVTYSSLLNDRHEIPQVLALTAVTVALVLAVLHFSQFRPVGWIMMGVAVLAVAAQAWALVSYRDSGVYWRPGLAVYDGFVWPYFDFVILPDGTFHPATKLHDFNPRDRQFFLRQRSDIILVGAGPNGEGGNGFRSKRPHFMYNPDLKRGTQIVILPTQQACEEFNWLKKEGKNVFFIVNND